MATKLLWLSLLIPNLLLHMSHTAESAYASKIEQSKEQLAASALAVSVSKTQSCLSFLKKMQTEKGKKVEEYNALRDCVENVDGSVDRLNQSVKELGLLGKSEGKDFQWHLSNIQTWVSAAITGQQTCLDGLEERNLGANFKAAIKPRVQDASKLTSNALALVNRLAK